MEPDLKYQKAIYILVLRIYFDTLALAEIKVKVQIFLLENLRPGTEILTARGHVVRLRRDRYGGARFLVLHASSLQMDQG